MAASSFFDALVTVTSTCTLGWEALNLATSALTASPTGPPLWDSHKLTVVTWGAAVLFGVTFEADGALMGTVDFGGVRKDVCLAYVPDLQVGDWTIVHVGFALTKLDEASAKETLAMMRSVGMLAGELGTA